MSRLSGWRKRSSRAYLVEAVVMRDKRALVRLEPFIGTCLSQHVKLQGRTLIYILQGVPRRLGIKVFGHGMELYDDRMTVDYGKVNRTSVIEDRRYRNCGILGLDLCSIRIKQWE